MRQGELQLRRLQPLAADRPHAIVGAIQTLEVCRDRPLAGRSGRKPPCAPGRQSPVARVFDDAQSVRPRRERLRRRIDDLAAADVRDRGDVDVVDFNS